MAEAPPFRIAPTFTANAPPGLKIPMVTPMCSIHTMRAESRRRASGLFVPAEIRAHIGAFVAANLAGEFWFQIGQPDVVRPSAR